MTVFIYILLCFIWGTTWLAIKIGLQDAPPLFGASLRFLLAAAILSVIVRAKGISLPRGIKEWLHLGYPGLYMFGASYALVYTSEQYIDSALAAILFASFPFYIAILSPLVLKDKPPSYIVWLGMILGFGGVALISYDTVQTSSELFLGSSLALAASFLSAYGIILHRQKFVNENIYRSINVQMLFGGSLLLVSALIFEDFSSIEFTPELIGSLFYLTIFGTLVTFGGYYWLLRRISIVKASMIAFVTPLVAILAGVMFADESLSMMIIIGTALILSGMLLVIRR